MFLMRPRAPLPGFGPLARRRARPVRSASVSLFSQAPTALEVERLIDRLVRHSPVGLIGMLNAQTIGNLLGRVLLVQPLGDLTGQPPITHQPPHLGPAHPLVGLPLRTRGPVTGTPTVALNLTRDRRSRSPRPVLQRQSPPGRCMNFLTAPRVLESSSTPANHVGSPPPRGSGPTALPLWQDPPQWGRPDRVAFVDGLAYLGRATATHSSSPQLWSTSEQTGRSTSGLVRTERPRPRYPRSEVAPYDAP